MKIREILIKALPAILLLLFTWWRASAMLARVTDPDPGLFEAFAYHLLEGKTLYLDIWDHKPPLIFFLNLGFLHWFGVSENGISYGSLMLCLIQTLVFYALLLKLTKSVWVSFAGTVVFISTFFSVFLFGSGNYTEQYGVLLTSAGLLSFLHFWETKNTVYLWLSGFAFGISIWFKEPFLFSALPIAGMLLLVAIKEKKYWKFLFAFALSFLIPALIVPNILALTGSWPGFREQLLHNQHYALQSQKIPFGIKLRDNFGSFFGPLGLNSWFNFGFWLSGAFFLLLSPKTRVAAVLILAQQLADYFATGISGNRFFHYYMQSFPLTVLVVFAGFSQIPNFGLKMNKPVFAWVWVSLIAALFVAKTKPWEDLKSNPEKMYEDPIAAYLNNREFSSPRSVAMGGKDIGFYLLRVKGISELRYIVPFPYHWIQVPGKPKNIQMDENKIEFINWMPEYVIYSGSWAEMYQDCALDSFVMEHYTEVTLTDMMPGATAHLLKRNDN